jgi:hypothetical protein
LYPDAPFASAVALNRETDEPVPGRDIPATSIEQHCTHGILLLNDGDYYRWTAGIDV